MASCLPRRPLPCSAVSLCALLFLAPPLSAATVRGTVVDADEHPVAGASVWLYRAPAAESSDTAERARAASTVTRADGAFSLPCGDAPAGELMLFAHRPGSAIACCEAPLPDRPLWIQLATPAPMMGRVVGPDKAPPAGVHVTLSTAMGTSLLNASQGWYYPVPELARELAVTTGADGTFELSLAPEGWHAEVQIDAPGYGTGTLTWRDQQEPIVLQPAGRLNGRIAWPEDAEPPARVPITAMGASGAFETLAHMTAFTSAGRQGHFAFPELPPGTYRVFCLAQPAGKYHIDGAADVTIESGVATELELAVVETYPLRGRVVAADTGRPVAGAAVGAVITPSGDMYPAQVQASSAADGRFELRGRLGEGFVHVAGPPGYGQPDTATFTLTESGVDLGDISLPRAYPVTVRAVDEAGALVRGAALLWSEHDDLAGWPLGTTDAEGRFVIEETGPEERGVRAVKGGLSSETVAVDATRPGGTVVLAMRPWLTAGLRARIVDQHGTPLAEATADIATAEETWGAPVTRTTSGPDGVVQVEGLVPGVAYRLSVGAEGGDPAISSPWTAADGKVQDLGDVVLRQHRGELHGVVVGPNGKPVPDAAVTVSLDSRALRETRTDAQGRFSLSGLVEGWVYAFVAAEGFAFAAAPLQTGQDSRRIALRRASRLVTGEPILSPLPPPSAKVKAAARALVLDVLQHTGRDCWMPRARLLQSLAKLDPAAAYEAAARGKDDPAPVHLVVGAAHLAEDFETSLALMRQGNEPYEVIRALVTAAEGLASERPDTALACLDAALELLPSVKAIGHSVPARAVIGERLLRLGDSRARDLLLQAAREAAGVDANDDDTNARAIVARAVCLVDLDAALGLIRSAENGEPDQFYVPDLAEALATLDPDAALKLADTIHSEWSREAVRMEIAAAMPAARLEEALELVSVAQEPVFRARALAQLARTAPAQRVPELLDRAAADLESDARRRLQKDDDYAGLSVESLAHLAIIARQRGVAGYREYAWRAAALKTRGGSYYPRYEATWYLRRDTGLAEALAYGDPDLARHVLSAGLDEAGTMASISPEYLGDVAQAMCRIDPEWAMECARSQEDAATASVFRLYVAQELGEVLGSTREQQEQRLLDVYEPHGAWLP